LVGPPSVYYGWRLCRSGGVHHASQGEAVTVVLRLWIFDFDGTLSPLVPERQDARILPQARDLLGKLAAKPGERVAVLSGRVLDDLIPRVEVPGVYLGGARGLEWLLPEGKRMTAMTTLERLPEVRQALLPEIGNLLSLPGISLQDRGWSLAIHLHQVAPEHRDQVSSYLKDRLRRRGIRFFHGSEIFEIHLLPEVDKVLGVRTICAYLEVDPAGGHVVYAGDDQKDGVAMVWVIQKGGLAVKVGYSHNVPGAWHVKDPAALVSRLRKLAGLGRETVTGARRFTR
jgi:trehalose-phosphatase